MKIKKYFSGWDLFTALIFCMVIITMAVLYFSTTVHAAECQDQNTLTPQLKKTYYESVKMCKEIGCSVSIRCYQKS